MRTVSYSDACQSDSHSLLFQINTHKAAFHNIGKGVVGDYRQNSQGAQPVNVRVVYRKTICDDSGALSEHGVGHDEMILIDNLLK
jgi:hypothetical protein